MKFFQNFLIVSWPRFGLGLAILAATFSFWRKGRREGFNEEGLLDLVLVTLVAGILGGKLAAGGPFLRFWEGPYLFAGSLAGGLAAGWLLSRRRGWSVAKIADLAIAPLILGLWLYWGSQLVPWKGDWWAVGRIFFYFSLYLFIALSRGWVASSAKAATLYFGLLFLLELIFSREVVYLVFLGGCVLGWRRSKMSLNTSFLEQLKQKLLHEKKEIEQQKMGLEKEEPYLEPGRTEINADLVEDAQEDVAQARYSVVKGSVSKMYAQVQKALAKVHLGTYGKCEKCHGEIDPARLKAFPAATLCLKCAQQADEQRASKEERPPEGVEVSI